MMEAGDKIQVTRPGNRRRLTGVITRIFTNQLVTQIEFRAYSTGGVYLSAITEVRPYDRTLIKQKEDSKWQIKETSRRRYTRPVKDMWD